MNLKYDYVLSYSPSIRKYLIGKVKSDCYYDNKKLSQIYNHIRDVVWIGKINRDDLKADTKNTLGAIT